jgi:predicted DCC family thiol-disulfide oxidoreductase YuxK
MLQNPPREPMPHNGGVAVLEAAAAVSSASVSSERRVFYDCECGFCIWMLAVVLRLDRQQRFRVSPIQQAREHELAAIPDDLVLASWHVMVDGSLLSGGPALAAVASDLKATRLIGRAMAASPKATASTYHWVAAHRGRLAKLIPERSKCRARMRVEQRRQQ